MKNTQKGLIVPLLIAVIAVLAIGSGVYYYSQNKTQQTPANNETTPSLSNLNTYTNYGFQFKYPKDFSVKEITCDTDPINCDNLQKPLLVIYAKVGTKTFEYMNIHYSKNVNDAMTPYDNGVESSPVSNNYSDLKGYFNKQSASKYNATTTLLNNTTTYVVKGPSTKTLWFEHQGVYSIGINSGDVFGFPDLNNKFDNIILSSFAFTK
jgi:hypothetical protein